MDPKWLIYLPPTMSPCGTSKEEGWLERPEEAFAYFAECGQKTVICEEKHMGSRAVITLVRDEETARTRFGVTDGSLGVIYSRTGRPFFKDEEFQNAVINRLRDALDRIDFWETHGTDWACIDCEIMPWSAKAQELLLTQYAPVGAAAELFTSAALSALEGTSHPELADISKRIAQSAENAKLYRKAYRPYCWEATDIDDFRIAPFHLLATEGAVHTEKTNEWHISFGTALGEVEPKLIQPTQTRLVDLEDKESVAAAIQWWESLTETGGEGMVVKPETFLVNTGRSPIQPAVKCRGREYLRIIYGLDYTSPENLSRLKQRKPEG